MSIEQQYEDWEYGELVRRMRLAEEESDRLKEENERFRKALNRITEHGMPGFGSPEQTWRECSLSVDRIAKQALEETNDIH